jgi:hypothetical protein
MIRIFMLVSMSLLFILLNSPALLMPSPAWAGCCGTTCKPRMCTCRGTYPCLFDSSDSGVSNIAQSSEAAIDGSSQMDIKRDAPEFSTTTSDFTERFMELTTATKCFRDKLALSLLGNARDNLKFVNFVTLPLDADIAK